MESLACVDLDLAARAACVAYVLCTVKLDLMSYIKSFGNYVAMLEGEWGDYEEGRAGADAIQSLKYSRRP